VRKVLVMSVLFLEPRGPGVSRKGSGVALEKSSKEPWRAARRADLHVAPPTSFANLGGQQ
jgi:hypothetical protein